MDPAYERRRLTSDEVARMMERGVFADDDEHLELIHGELVAAMGQGPMHRALTAKIHRELERIVGPGYHVVDHAPMVAGRYNLPEPDSALVRGEIEAYFRRLPTGEDIALIVEVSVTSQREDTAKAAIYAAAGVPQYWQVDVPARQVVVRTDPDRTRAVYTGERRVDTGDSVPLEGREVPVSCLLPPPDDGPALVGGDSPDEP